MRVFDRGQCRTLACTGRVSDSLPFQIHSCFVCTHVHVALFELSLCETLCVTIRSLSVGRLAAYKLVGGNLEVST